MKTERLPNIPIPIYSLLYLLIVTNLVLIVDMAPALLDTGFMIAIQTESSTSVL